MAMRIAILVVLVTGMSSAQTRTATAAERAACEEKIQRKIDAIDQRMRALYTAREGERLKQKRRKLEEERYACRKVA